MSAPTASRARATICSSFSRADPAERTPAELERAEPLGHQPLELVGQRLRLAHQDRGIGTDALEISAAEEPSDRLTRRLPEQVPERDVDRADGVGQRAAATEPEGVLVEDLARSLGLDGRGAAVQRLELGERGAHEIDIGERAAVADRALLGDDRDDRVDRVLRPQLVAPAALGRRAEEPDAP